MAEVTESTVDAPKRPGFSAAEYNSVAESASLGAINLLANHFEVNHGVDQDASAWKLSYGRKILSCTFDAENKFVAAVFQYTVTAKAARKKALVCSADFGVFYNLAEGASEAGAIGFCRNVGLFAAYPYFRALVSQLCWNAGLQLPPLPSIASTAHIQKKAKLPVQEQIEK